LKNLRMQKEIDSFPVPPYLFKKIDQPDELAGSYLNSGETVWESVPIKAADGELRVIVYWKGLWGLPVWEDPRGFLVVKNGEPVSVEEAKVLMEYMYVFIVFREKTSHRVGLENFVAGDMQGQYQFFGDIIREAKARFAGEGMEKYLAEEQRGKIPDIRQAFDQVSLIGDELKRLNLSYIKTGSQLLEMAQDAFSNGELQLDTMQRVYDQFILDSQVVQEFFNIYINVGSELGKVYGLISSVQEIEKEKEARMCADLVCEHLKKMRNASFDYKRRYKQIETDNGIYENFQEDKLKRFVFPLIRNQ